MFIIVKMVFCRLISISNQKNKKFIKLILSWENECVWRSVLEDDASLRTLTFDVIRVQHFRMNLIWAKLTRHSSQMPKKWNQSETTISLTKGGVECWSNDACNRYAHFDFLDWSICIVILIYFDIVSHRHTEKASDSRQRFYSFLMHDSWHWGESNFVVIKHINGRMMYIYHGWNTWIYCVLILCFHKLADFTSNKTQ